MLKRISVSYIIPCLAGIIMTLMALWFTMSSNSNVQLFRQRLSHTSYDIKQRFFIHNASLKKSHVVILDINESSLREYGRWPWSRRLMARIVDKLWRDGATVVGSDIVFSEREGNPVEPLLQSGLFSKTVSTSLIEKKEHFEYDALLEKSLARGDSVLPFVLFRQGRQQQGFLPKPLLTLSAKTSLQTLITSMPGYLSCLPRFAKQARDLGFISYFRDVDGITRQLPLLLQYRHQLFYSFTLAVVKSFLLESRIHVHWVNSHSRRFVNRVSIGAYDVPTNIRGEIYIPFYGRRKTFPYLSVKQFLKGDFSPNLLEGKIVLLGTSAVGLGDLEATPVDSTYPGVEIQANVIQGILDRAIPYRPLWLPQIEIMALLVLGLLFSVLLPWISSMKQGVFCFAMIVFLVLVDGGCWYYLNLVTHLIPLEILILMIGVFNFLYGFVFTQSHVRLLQSAFARYIPADQVKLISKDPTHFNLHGEERDMSVLFSDIRGFSTISEGLSATQVKELLNEFFTPMTKEIFDSKGSVDKYVGDMIVAFWGAPLMNDNHANDAVRSALNMLSVQKELNKEFQARGLPALEMGIGINSGKMNVGDMGSEYRQSYTVIGDNVNLGSRLEQLTKYYLVNCIVSEYTKRALTDFFCCRLDKIQVKGKEKSVMIYEPVCVLGEESADQVQVAAMLTEAQDYYFSQEWEKALAKFKSVERTGCYSRLCEIYRLRIDTFMRVAPPGQWDGSTHIGFKWDQ